MSHPLTVPCPPILEVEAALVAERDEYRRQAVALAEALIDLGHSDVVDRVLEEEARDV